MEAAALKVNKKIIQDESISHYEIHAHQPYGSSLYRNNDEIRIVVQHQDLCVLPCESSIHITGKFTKEDNSAVSNRSLLATMFACFLFDEIRYELNGIEIDRSKNVGVTTLMKGFPSFTPEQEHSLENSGMILDNKKLCDSKGNFDVIIPLKLLLGFAEDYKQVIINCKHELILIRANTDLNAAHQIGVAATAPENIKITLDKIEWLVPYVTMSDAKKVDMLSYISKDPSISIPFRSWELYEYPSLPITTKHIWSVKTTNQLEKPRYIIFALQTARKNNLSERADEFDHCKIKDFAVYLNSQRYPYANMNIDILNSKYALLYEMYANFYSSYYGKSIKRPYLNKGNFVDKGPFIVIDCSRQNESIKAGPVDVRLEFEASESFPANTTA